MSNERRLEKVEAYVRREMRLSTMMVNFYREKNDVERTNQWSRRYDCLFGVLLQIVG